MAPLDTVQLEENHVLSQYDFTVTHQEVSLDLDFHARRIRGHATITIRPLSEALQYITLNCRQLDVKSITVDGIAAKSFDYDDPGQRITPRDGYTIAQHHLIDGALTGSVAEFPDGELRISLPPKVKIKGLSAEEQAQLLSDPQGQSALDAQTLKLLEEEGKMYRALTVRIEYVITSYRDALHWVGLIEEDERYPHMYTRHQVLPGDVPCFVFPCLDSLSARCTWRLTVRCPRTLGDLADAQKKHLATQHSDSSPRPTLNFDETERLKELIVISSGYMEDADAAGEMDDNKRKWIFSSITPVSAHFVGFVVGPFEKVDLSGFRETVQDEKLGDSAVRLHAYCLPGREDEVQNTCQPLTTALDFFTETYGSYPFQADSLAHKLCFVDDLPQNVVDMASLSLVTPRLLFPADIIDNMYENLRELVHALTNQWLGVSMVPQSWNDYWIIVGGSWFMADSFMSKLAGRNEYRYRQRIAADRVIELDVKRPSIHALGPVVNISPSNLEFMLLKAPLVLFILDNRIIKASGRNGVSRMFYKVFMDAKTGKIANNEISTDAFMAICQKIGHTKLDTFFQQWIYGAGCPTFAISQRFNKKKLVVEMVITQRTTAAHQDPKVEPHVFMRDAKELEQDVWAGDIQPVFTGPMTVRIIEMDGTPFEHIVEIREHTVKFDIPYNTKYKRLKQKKRQKEAAVAGVQADGEEGTDRAAIYRLGNILPDDDAQIKASWRLKTWSEEDDKQMKEDFAEWVRIDKDFEWICRIMPSQPAWMYASQLSQDNDVVAHMESIKFFHDKKSYMGPTILVRTLMDPRYFHGIRIMAAEALASYGMPEADPERTGLFHLQKAFQELFCHPGQTHTRSNDFSDRSAYMLQCAIPKALARIRDSEGKAPDEVRTFFIDKMRTNDNQNNEFSDNYYVSTLLSCMARTFVQSKDTAGAISFDFGETFEQESVQLGFQKITIDELDRHRRIDEWIPSFQNLYTLTALECATTLMKEKAIPKRFADIIKYTKSGNADTVRLKAFDCLVDLDAFRSSQIRGYMLYAYASETSPYVRDRLWEIIGRGLGVIATTAPSDSDKMMVDSGFSIDDNNVDKRQEALARHTIDGALKSIKQQLMQDPLLQSVVFEGLHSPCIGFKDAQNLLVICRMLYDTTDHLIFKRKLPKFWAVTHLGAGKLRFFETDKVRTKPRFKPEPPRKPEVSLKIGLKLNTKPAVEDFAPGKLTRPTSPEAKRVRTSLSATPEVKRRESVLKRAREDSVDDVPLAQQRAPDPKRQRLVASDRDSNSSRAASPADAAMAMPTVISLTAKPKAPKINFKSSKEKEKEKESANGMQNMSKPLPSKAKATPPPAMGAGASPAPPERLVVKLKFSKPDKLRRWPAGKSGHRSKKSAGASTNGHVNGGSHVSQSAASAERPAAVPLKLKMNKSVPSPLASNGSNGTVKKSSTPSGATNGASVVKREDSMDMKDGSFVKPAAPKLKIKFGAPKPAPT